MPDLVSTNFLEVINSSLPRTRNYSSHLSLLFQLPSIISFVLRWKPRASVPLKRGFLCV